MAISSSSVHGEGGLTRTGVVRRNRQWCGCLLLSLLLSEGSSIVVMLCSAQPAPRARWQGSASPQHGVGGTPAPNICRVPASPLVPCLATGCCHRQYSLYVGTGQHFPCHTHASSTHISMCETTRPSVCSPHSEGKRLSPGMGASGLQPFSMCRVFQLWSGSFPPGFTSV